MGHNGVTHAFNLVNRHVGVGGQCQVIGFQAVINETVDGRMHLVPHRLDDNAIDSVVMPLAGRLEDVQA